MLLQKIKQTIQNYNLLARGDTIIVGVSGGPDSLALLYVLDSLKREWNLKIHVAHLDHMMRKDSWRDRQFVQRTCQRLGIPVTSHSINIKAIARKGSLEEIARNARLGFFMNLAKNTKATKIALGHTLDDQAETVLMRLIRGTGLYGLSSILPKRTISGFTIIRPLLEVRRKEIEQFLRRKKISPRRDSTNSQDVFFRNKIRNGLMPLLEKKYNRNIKEVLSFTALTAGYDYDYLLQQADRQRKACGARINLRKFSRLHPSMQRLLLRLYIAHVKGDMRRIGFVHIKEIEDLINTRPVNAIVDLPGSISVKKSAQTLVFYRKKS